MSRVVAVFPNPFAQHILMDIVIRALRDSKPTLPDQFHRLKLVLAAEYSSLHEIEPRTANRKSALDFLRYFGIIFQL